VITIPELAEQLGSYPNGMINAKRIAMRKNWTFKNTVLTRKRFTVVHYFEDDSYIMDLVEEQQERMSQEFDCRCEDCGEGMDEDDLVCPSCGELAGFDRELNPETRNDFLF